MKRSKYGVRTDAAGIAARTVDNIRFDSLKEAKRYQELKLLQKSGVITNLEYRKPLLRFLLTVNGIEVCKYVADFSYWNESGERVIEDCKGMKTPVYKLKKRLMLACRGIEIRET